MGGSLFSRPLDELTVEEKRKALEELVAALEADDRALTDVASLDESAILKLIDKLPTMVAYWDRNQRCRYANAAYSEWFGRSLDALTGMSLEDVVGPATYATVKPLIEKVLEGEPQRFERPLVSKAGTSKHWLASYIPDVQDGVVVGFLVLITDVTDLHRLREDNERRASELELLIELLPVGVSMLDADGKLLMSNAALRRIIAMGEDAESELRNRQLIHPDGSPFEPDDLPKVVARREQRAVGPAEIGVPKPDGSIGWVAISAAPVPSSDAVLIVTRDITQERAARAEQLKSAARFSAMLDSSPVPLALNDEHGNITYLNAAFTTTFGYMRDDIPTLAEWWPRAYPDPAYRERTITEWGRRLGHARKSSERFEPLEIEVVTKGGGRRVVIGSAVSLSGAFEGEHLVVLFDVSERARAEELRKDLEGQLRQVQKMEAIGSFASGLAHDFNGVMHAILGVAEVMLAEGSAGHLTADLTTIADAAKRGAQLSRQILTLSRPAAFELTPVSLPDVVGEATRLLRASTPRTIEIEVTEAAALPRVLADAAQVQQLLLNLCTNALHAMHQRPGKLTVTLEPWRGAPVSGRPEAAFLRMSVKDTGDGIPDDIRARIFDPFFTTRSAGDGTGLGLAVVRTIVEAHHGAITLDTDVGQGTTFHVYWPVAVQEPVPPAPSPSEGGRPLHVLFVDDDATICKVAERWLTRHGCRVTTFSDPHAALASFSATPGEYDVVVTDLSMPSMSGVELATRLLAVRAGVPVILATGNPGDLTGEEVRAIGLRELMHKPIPLAELLLAVTRAAAPPG